MSEIPQENGEPIPYDESIINTIRGKSLMYPPEVGNEIRVLCRMLDWCEEHELTVSCDTQEASVENTLTEKLKRIAKLIRVSPIRMHQCNLIIEETKEFKEDD